MRRPVLLLLPVLLSWASAQAVHAQSDAALHQLRRTESHARVRTDLLRVPAAMSGGAVAIEELPDGTRHVGVLVRVTSGAALDALRARGARIGGVAGDVVSVRMPVDAVASLDSMPGIHSAQAARLLLVEPQVDTSTVVIRADALRSHTGERWTGATGAGTLVGVYDTGLDVRHRDFQHADGATRVVAAWDQTLFGAGPPGFGYGVLCDGASVQELIDTQGQTGCPMLDPTGHGTHVTGTAAGNGAESELRALAGVAPEAELLVVKGGDGAFSESLIVDGLVWMQQRAAALGRPLVVNLSLGGQAGPHDGTRLFERAIDNLSGPGFIVVAAVGNYGQNQNTVPAMAEPQLFHARGTASSATTRFTFDVGSYLPLPFCEFNSLVISAWYEAADSVEVSVVRPDGTRVSAVPGTFVTDSTVGGHVLLYNALAGPDAGNGDGEVGIIVDGCEDTGLPAEGTWAIEMQPRAALPSGAPMDLWLHTLYVGTGAVYGRDGFDNRIIVSAPASAQSVIAVGAFVSRLCWRTATGDDVCYTQKEDVGDLARFSAGGPTRDGRMKPDVTAPGLGIAAPRSRHAPVAFQRVIADGRYAVFEGTSMATPHVTGAVALLLEQQPTLGPEQARAILTDAAGTDAFTANRYDTSVDATAADWWGAGKLDACAAVVSTAADGGVWVAPASDTLPRGASLQLKVCARDGGAAIAWHTTAPDVVSVDADGSALALQDGTALLIASDGTRADTAVMTVVAPATLAITATSARPADVVNMRQDARIPLLALTMVSDGVESTDVEQIGVVVEGIDESAWIVLAEADAAGNHDALPPFAAAMQLGLSGRHVIELRPELPIRVLARDTARYVVLLQTSGMVPNGTQFTVGVDTSTTISQAARSGARDRFTLQGESVTVESTLLAAEQALQLSENPVRHASVHFNFRGCPRRAAVHALTGTRVRDLHDLLVCGESGGHAEWDLRNEDGSGIAPGVYLVLFDLDGRIFREKLMVLRAAAP